MTRDLPGQDEFMQRRLERLELRLRRARFILAGAHSAYQALRDAPAADALQLRQALQRVEQAQQQLVDIPSTIEFLEDQADVA